MTTADTRTSDDTAGTTGPRPGDVTVYFSGEFALFGLDDGANPRGRADTLCSDAMAMANTGCGTAVALISVDTDDTLLALVQDTIPDAPVRSNGGLDLAPSFEALLTNGQETTLTDAQVSYADAPGERPDRYPTGTINGGGVGNNCANWASSSGAHAVAGSSDGATANAWITGGQPFPCGSADQPILCACW